MHYQFPGMDDAINESQSSSYRHRTKNSSGQSVVSMGSEFAQKAKGLIHLLNCDGRQEKEQGKEPRQYNSRNLEREELNYGQVMEGSPR
mmetsp:Transcript_21279/g.46180  ORF Transcript_21279/g.46180 Transcript_21279/m.46180 type:complete len:89 (-) Transcript_21279:110-376(-)